MLTQEVIDAIEGAMQGAINRETLWSRLFGSLHTKTMAEVGVWRGEFAESILRNCPEISKYYMIDAWHHLPNWNKPFNVSESEFEEVMSEAMKRTEFSAHRRQVLRGTTLEMAESIPNKSLDVCYIDGDHTLRGITIDLIKTYDKVVDGGILGGDDFVKGAWQHSKQYEPTMVFPLAVYFAEATGSTICCLPYNQFALIVNRAATRFEMKDYTGSYNDTTISGVLRSKHTSFLSRLIRRLRRL
jgi:hypothetical protein